MSNHHLHIALYTDNATVTSPGQVVGELYSPNLMPDFCPDQFHLVNDKLVQHDIRDVHKNLIPCWKNAEGLRPGTVVMILASLDIYNIMVERTDPTRGFRRVSPPLPNDSRYKFAKTSPVLPNQRAEDPSHGRIFGRL